MAGTTSSKATCVHISLTSGDLRRWVLVNSITLYIFYFACTSRELLFAIVVVVVVIISFIGK